MSVPVLPLFRIPPVPGARTMTLARRSSARASVADLERVIDAMRSNKVGGTYWGAQPALPSGDFVAVRVRDPEARARALASLEPGTSVLRWPSVDVDPWHVFDTAGELILDANDELAVLAAIAGTPVRRVDESGTLTPLAADKLLSCLREELEYANPFTGESIDVIGAIELCAFWRRLIDSNRSLGGAVGFAAWKKSTVEPLLWGGAGSDIFAASPSQLPKHAEVATWRAKAAKRTLAELESRQIRIVEIEDGFIRSAGLGADCVPPLSIVVDRLGAYFDPSRPSDLEELIESGTFSEEALKRARQLRQVIVESGISKYEVGTGPTPTSSAGRHSILVPGQVEDDRAVLLGGQGLVSNLELLRRVRSISPNSYVIYKPHPDVEAGHRRGAIADKACLEIADEIVRNQPISDLIDAVDEVHVNTSLAGFEALLRDKPVTTHGMPFYAGWGLTRDLGEVPARRTARRTLDELVAAALLVYPRYLDPVTGLPCPPEVLLRRLIDQGGSGRQPLVALRRLQGAIKRQLRNLAQRVAG